MCMDNVYKNEKIYKKTFKLENVDEMGWKCFT
uniref:Uncharacterized protein n=1 Tax=Tetranychus urticae TaxID=32264 RepID=T1K6G4_TETUR